MHLYEKHGVFPESSRGYVCRHKWQTQLQFDSRVARAAEGFAVNTCVRHNLHWPRCAATNHIVL